MARGGALMLVGPQQYVTARRELVGLELQSFHMIIAEGLGYLLAEVLASLPFQRRPKIKQGERGRRRFCSARSSVDEPVAEDTPPCAEDDVLWASLLGRQTMLRKFLKMLENASGRQASLWHFVLTSALPPK